eukprot:7484773-Ditylum_brightwellii.AAC.1
MEGLIDAVYIGPPIEEDDGGVAILPPTQVIEFRSVNGLALIEKLSIAAGALFYVILLLCCFAWYKKRFSAKNESEADQFLVEDGDSFYENPKATNVHFPDQGGSITEDDSIDTGD